MPFKKGHTGFRTKESYRRAGIKIAKNPNSIKTQFKKGMTPWSKSNKGVHLSLRSEFKKGHAPWNKGKKYHKISRKKHWNWKGGITPVKKIIRESLEYKLWRKTVFTRDNWTCQICFSRGKNVNADHIKQFAFHPKLRFLLSNGRTLCQRCHRKQLSSNTRKHVCCKV